MSPFPTTEGRIMVGMKSRRMTKVRCVVVRTVALYIYR